MQNDLKSNLWGAAIEQIRSCHLSLLSAESANVVAWKDAFNQLVAAIKDERKLDPAFSKEIDDLTSTTGITYDFGDILEEYFDFLEEKKEWDDVITSCDELISLFKWEHRLPSEYMFRKGNALEKSNRLDEAESFGKIWLEKYPTDLYAAASNVYLMLKLGKTAEAEALTEKFLRDDLVCDDTTDTFFMAAYRLYEMTDNINAKKRVEAKMADYQNML